MITANALDAAAAIIPGLLRTLRLPTIGRMWEELCQQAEAAHWSHQRFLQALLEHEAAERDQRRTAARRRASRLPMDKTLSTFKAVCPST